MLADPDAPLQMDAGAEIDTEGVSLITTTVEPAGDVHPPTVTVTSYVPAAARVTFGIEGFCWVEVNPFGPVQP